MKVRYILDVNIPGEDYRNALELHVELQGAVAEVLMDNGYTTDGMKAVRLDPVDPTAPGGAKEKGAMAPLMNWTHAAVESKGKRESGGSGCHGK